MSVINSLSSATPTAGAKQPAPQEIETLVGLFAACRHDEASTLARAMTVQFPLHWVGWKMLGVVLQQTGRSADALAPMQKAAALSPGDAEAHHNLGIILQNLGRLDEAEVSYRRALRIKPDYFQAHNNLGATLQALGRLDEAETCYRRALEIHPEDADAHYSLGNLLKKQGRPDEAEACYRQVLQIDPGFAAAHIRLGITLKELNRPIEAQVCYRMALRIAPDCAEAHNNLGNILHDQGKPGEAEACYRQALQINPDLAEAHTNLGATLKDMGRKDEADACFRRALEINPDDVNAFNHLSVAFEHDQEGQRIAFSGLNYNINHPALFLQSVENIRKSIVTPDHFFCADNVITWNKNLSFLKNRKFMETVQRNSDTSAELTIVWRSYILCYFAKYAKRLDGDFVEVGTYKGNTANIILEEAALADASKSYFLYDTFEHAESDINHAMDALGPELFDKVKARFAQHDFVKVIKGYVPDSFAQGFPEKIAFAHVDLNQAPAEVAALQRIIPVLAPGGVIVLDDYGWHGYRQQKEAEDPLFAEYGLEVLELPTGQGLVLNNF